MAKKAGYEVTWTLSGLTVSLNSVSLRRGVETVDITTFDSASQWAEFIATIKSFDGSFNGFVDDTNTIDIGDTGTLSITFGDTAKSGSVIIDGITQGAEVRGAQTQNFAFKGTGAWAAAA